MFAEKLLGKEDNAHEIENEARNLYAILRSIKGDGKVALSNS